MTQSEIKFLELLIGSSTSLLGVSVTLVALVPTLVELVRVKSPDFLTMQQSEYKLGHLMYSLLINVIVFTLTLISGLSGQVASWKGFLWIGAVSFSIGLLIIVINTVFVFLSLRNSI